MRENRPYGSEGGEVQKPSLPLPRFRCRQPVDLAALRPLTPQVVETITTRSALGTRRPTISWRRDRGREDVWPPLPPNRTGGFPAYGSPVDGFLIIGAVSLAARPCPG